MNFEITFPGFDDLQDRIVIQHSNLTAAKLRKPLSEIGKILRQDTKDKIASAEGYPPLAASTLEKRAHTGTSAVTKHGNIRASKMRGAERKIKRLQGYIAWSRNRYLGRFMAPPEAAQRKINAWQRQIENLNRQLAKSQETWYEDRKTGTSVLQRHQARQRPLLGKIPGTLHLVIKAEDGGGVVWLRSRWSKQAAVRAHNEGDGHVPERKIFEIKRKHIATFRAILTRHGIIVVWPGVA